MPQRPSILPIGRLDIDFGRGARLKTARLNIDDGSIQVRVLKEGRESTVRLAMDVKHPVLGLVFPNRLQPRTIHRVPAWEYVGEYLEQILFAPPELFDTDKLVGWTQMRPADPTLAVGFRAEKGELLITAVYGEDATAARTAASRLVSRSLRRGFARLLQRNKRWWNAYWRDVPKLEIPNGKLHFLYQYGMYKFAGLTSPEGVAAILQGAWVEDYQMPPWSNDYHFNINVQMWYWPAYHGNRLEHLRPLCDLIDA